MVVACIISETWIKISGALGCPDEQALHDRCGRVSEWPAGGPAIGRCHVGEMV